jgi:Chromatin associated protein KTI12
MTKKIAGAALTEHAHGRSEGVRAKLREAMKKIELEIDENGGIYPVHGGRLSLSEVCRRAGVHKVTMQGPAHRETTKKEIEGWIKRIKATLIAGRKTVRKTVTARANDWEEKYKAVANKFNEMYAIEVIEKDKLILELKQKIGLLEEENVMLRAELSAGKVVRFPVNPPVTAVKPQKKGVEEPRLVLIRGVPGSGKSTRARELQEYLHFEADMYFIRDGAYTFDSDLLPAAHQCAGTRK